MIDGTTFTPENREACVKAFAARKRTITLGKRKFELRPHRTRKDLFMVMPANGDRAPMAVLNRK